MKKVLSIMFALTVILASCSKERKLNRKLDGEWNVETVDGMSPSLFGATIVMSFDKDKKDDGSATMTWTDATGTEVETGKYELNKDEEITIKWDGADPEVMTVTDYDKKDMTITSTETDDNGVKHLSTIVLKKK